MEEELIKCSLVELLKMISILLMYSFKCELLCYVFRWSKPILEKLDDKWMKKRNLMWSEEYEDKHRIKE